MSTTPEPPPAAAPRRPPQVLFRLINPVLRLLLSSPLHGPVSHRLMLLAVTGRRTGRTYTIPVGYARQGQTLLTGTEGRWARNLRGSAPVRVWLRGRERDGVADLITDEEGMQAAYRMMIAKAPQYGRAIGVALDAAGEPDREAVARARQSGHVVVRVHLK